MSNKLNIPCPADDCNRTFDDYVSLEKHQRGCKLYKAMFDTSKLVSPPRNLKRQPSASKSFFRKRNRVSDNRANLAATHVNGAGVPAVANAFASTSDTTLDLDLPGLALFDDAISVTPSSPSEPIILLPVGTTNSSQGFDNAGEIENEARGDIPSTPPARAQSPSYQPDKPRTPILRRLRPRRAVPAVDTPVEQEQEALNIQAVDSAAGPSLPQRIWRTSCNKFRLFRVYDSKPTQVAKSSATPGHSGPNQPNTHVKEDCLQKALLPFKNFSSFLYTKWYLGNPEGGNSHGHSNHFTKEVIKHPRWCCADIEDFDIGIVRQSLASCNPTPGAADQSWFQSPISIDVPLGSPRKGSADTFPASAQFDCGTLHHRSIVEIVKAVAASDPLFETFIWTPYRQYVQNDNDVKERVYQDEMTADHAIHIWQKLQQDAAESGEGIEWVPLFLKFWSDSTHLTQFGTHSLWPIYMCFANQPRWQRDTLHLGSWHDLAYIPGISNTLNQFFEELCHKLPSKEVPPHVKREMMQAVWEKLLDDGFIEACKTGIVITFPDGVKRRVFFRIITYSADYPEKILLALVRDMGRCPCPRCFITKNVISGLGFKSDMQTRIEGSRSSRQQEMDKKVLRARKLIYVQRKGIKSKPVESLLKDESCVPTINVFTKRLSCVEFKIWDALAVDLLHEVELGVWKDLLHHLVRILYSISPTLVEEMNRRFKAVPPFGQATFRTINYNVSQFPKLAARDYENLLQVAIPVFEGLLRDEEDQILVNSILYILSGWHGIAKFRIQTETTLDILAAYTRAFGKKIRVFQLHMCLKYNTVELDIEFDRRKRRAARKKSSTESSRQAVRFSTETYKFHALGDYVRHIQTFGVTGNFNTRAGELRHKLKKKQYSKTSKHNFEAQIAQDTVIHENLHIIDNKVSALLGEDSDIALRARHALLLEEPFDPDSSRKYIIADGEKFHVQLDKITRGRENDPAFKNFHSQLYDHLLARLRKEPYTWDLPIYCSDDYASLHINNSRLYPHSTIRINYTSYDMRRGHDSLKSFLSIKANGVVEKDHSQRSYIMLPADEKQKQKGAPPFWYAQVLGIFHANACDRQSESSTMKFERLDFLWIRWLGYHPDHLNGQPPLTLFKVGYIPESEEDPPYGFIDPSDVIRAAHIIPSFRDGGDIDVGASEAHGIDGDWAFYVINRAADRDMLMRDIGGGLGHIHPSQQSGLPSSFHDEVLSAYEATLSEAEASTYAVDSPTVAPSNVASDDEINQSSGDEACSSNFSFGGYSSSCNSD